MRASRKSIVYIELLHIFKKYERQMLQQAVIKKLNSIAPAHSKKRSRLLVLAPAPLSRNTCLYYSSETSDIIAPTRPKKDSGTGVGISPASQGYSDLLSPVDIQFHRTRLSQKRHSPQM
jgi:hypothetical protein